MSRENGMRIKIGQRMRRRNGISRKAEDKKRARDDEGDCT
jgi:hypothetical protein